MLLTVAALFLGTRSVLFFLKCISAAKVIGVLVPPFLVEPALLLSAAFSSTTGLLPLLEPRMGMKPATTERTPPPREHTFLLQRRACFAKLERKGKKKIKTRRIRAIEEDVLSDYWSVKRSNPGVARRDSASLRGL
jgi:hypothetical protein